MKNVFDLLEACSTCGDIQDKIRLVRELKRRWDDGELTRDNPRDVEPIGDSGRPVRPELVHPRNLARRSLHTPDGVAAFLHAIAHIEFNAINLALDAAYRFREMPDEYTGDWIRVASEEALHFELLNNCLIVRGYGYGDFGAHNGLWTLAQKTAHDVLARLALIPRVMEARGLDVTPMMIKRVESIGAEDIVAVLRVILRDEIGHVETGSIWFHFCCDQRGLDREETFYTLFRQYTQGQVKLPLHRDARLKAGFTRQELLFLEGEAR